MVDFSKGNVIKVSKETNFLKDNVEKVLRLADILENVFSSKWGKKLVLKGGTAINMFYRNMPRLSVDIDLDYIGETREEMLQDRENIQDYLRSQMFQKGYSLAESSKSYFALTSYVFRYINNAENRDNIKIEINFLDRVHILPINYNNISILGIDSDVLINVLDRHELYGSKLAALIDRSKPRDVYDVQGLLGSKNDFELDKLRKCFIFYNCIGGNADILQFDDKKIDLITKRDYDRMLKPMLSKQEKFNNTFAVEQIKVFLKELMVFTENEVEFVQRFKSKVYKPELLFDNETLIKRVAHHPMAIWKCEK